MVLKETLKLIASKGGSLVEAFPFDLEDSKKPNYNGTVRMFQREGFQKVARLGKIFS